MGLGWLGRFFLRDRQNRGNSASEDDRTVLLVTCYSSEQNTLRAIANAEPWRLLVAPSLDCAMRILQQEPVTVVLYDRDLPTITWQGGFRTLLRGSPLICLILLSPVLAEQLRWSVLSSGGYDIARRPVDRAALVRLVNGYCALRKEIDAVESKAPAK